MTLSITSTRESWAGASRTIRESWTADSLRGRFTRGAVWTMAGAVAAQGSTLITSVIAARILGREHFGHYGMILSTVGMFGVFAGLGLSVTATKYVAEFRISDPERAGRIIALSSAVAILTGGLLALVLLVFAPLLAANTLNAPELASGLRISSLFLLLTAINGAQTGALSGFEAFRAIARINVVRGVAALPVTTLALLLWGLPGALWGLAATAVIPCFLSYVALQRQCMGLGIRPRLSSGWAEARVIWTFSIPAVLCSALVGPATWAANAMLVNQPGGYAEMGLFSAANQWRNAISFVPGVLAQFALPLLCNLKGEQDLSRYTKTLRWNLVLTATAATALAVPVALAAPYIMRLYGDGFQQGSMVLVLAAAIAVISCVNSVVGTAILSAASVWAGFAFNAMWAAVLLIGCRYLIPTNLAAGLAVAMLGAYMAHTVWQLVYLRRRLGPETPAAALLR